MKKQLARGLGLVGGRQGEGWLQPVNTEPGRLCEEV